MLGGVGEGCQVAHRGGVGCGVGKVFDECASRAGDGCQSVQFELGFAREVFIVRHQECPAQCDGLGRCVVGGEQQAFAEVGDLECRVGVLQAPQVGQRLGRARVRPRLHVSFLGRLGAGVLLGLSELGGQHRPDSVDAAGGPGVGYRGSVGVRRVQESV